MMASPQSTPKNKFLDAERSVTTPQRSPRSAFTSESPSSKAKGDDVYGSGREETNDDFVEDGSVCATGSKSPFRIGLAIQLEQLQIYTMDEVLRLQDMVDSLKAENHRLCRQESAGLSMSSVAAKVAATGAATVLATGAVAKATVDATGAAAKATVDATGSAAKATGAAAKVAADVASNATLTVAATAAVGIKGAAAKAAEAAEKAAMTTAGNTSSTGTVKFEPTYSFLDHSDEARELKTKVRAAINPPEYCVTDLYWATGFFQKLAKAQWFERGTILVVCLNALWISVELDHHTNGDASPVWLIMEQFFCVMFSSELLVRLLACRPPRWRVMTDHWFAFDAVLVTMMVLETWIVPLVVSITGGTTTNIFANASVLRLLRLVRITRMSKLMRMLPEIMILVHGMAHGMRSVLAASLLLTSINYIFAIVFRQLTAGTEVGHLQFRSVPDAMYSLFVEACLGGEDETLAALGQQGWLLGILFFVFLFLTALTIMNMLVGVMCQVMTRIADQKRDQVDLEAMLGQLRSTLTTIDQDFDDFVSHVELQSILNSDVTIQALDSHGVDVHALVDDADIIFEGCEARGLSFQEFSEVVSRYRANHAATISAVSGLRTFCRVNMKTITNHLSLLNERLTGLEGIHLRQVATFEAMFKHAGLERKVDVKSSPGGLGVYL